MNVRRASGNDATARVEAASREALAASNLLLSRALSELIACAAMAERRGAEGIGFAVADARHAMGAAMAMVAG